MSKSIISEGKTSSEAIEKGLKELKVSKNMVDIKILENEEKRSFFSILAPRIVKVELTIKETENRSLKEEIDKNIKREKNSEVSKESLEKAKGKLEEFLKEFFYSLKLENVNYNVKIENNMIYIDIKDEKVAFLIGYRGETLNSFQNILTSIINNIISEKIKIILDIEGYRLKREKQLEELAEKLSKTVIRNVKMITLEPMSAYERKIIHSKLQENKKVKTYSIGEEPNRKIVIELNK